MPGSNGKRRQAGRLRRRHHEGEVVHPAESAFSDGRIVDGGGVAFVGDLDRKFQAVDVKTGVVLWKSRLATSVQGFPVSFQYRWKTVHRGDDRLGGGSPRNVPGRSFRKYATLPAGTL